MKRNFREPLLGWVFAAVLGAAAAAHAQAIEAASDPVPALPDSVAAAESLPAPPDSLIALEPDSLGVVLPDSLDAWTDADSLGRDELESPPEAEAQEPFVLTEREERLRALRPSAVSSAWLDWRRTETLEGTIEALTASSIRIAGDTGMESHVSLSPVGFRAPEIWSDGIPTRSPGDLDPAIWDRSSIGVDAVGSSVETLGPIGGDPHVWLRRRAPVDGRTVMLTRFSSTSAETYQRAVSVTTPASNRVIRLDFEDWATNEGYDYSLAPNVRSSTFGGRASMRRFLLGTDFQIDEARVRFTFGRGRRNHRGDVLGAESTERWTGEVGVVVDHFGEDAIHSLSAWHLDFHDDERAFGQEVDAARQGLRWQRHPDGAGWGVDASVERWSMQTDFGDTLTRRADPSRVMRGAAFVQGDPQAMVWPWLRLAVVDGEHTSGELGLGGRAGLRLRRGAWSVAAIASRDLRMPTLLESDGARRFRTVTATGSQISLVAQEYTWQGNGRLDVEAEERVGVEVEGRLLGFDVDTALERWRLRDGIGWIADGEVARVVGDREVDALQVRGALDTAVRFGRADWRIRLRTQGHFVIDEIEVDADRGVGWPRWQARTRVGLDRTFFASHNRLGVDVEIHGRGTARDDALGPVAAVEVPVGWDVGGRVWLRVRDAEMSINYDNVLDRELTEVAGTFRRARQLRWQLVWPFFN